MKITVIGAGNSGLAMAAHLSLAGNEITLWNRTKSAIQKLSVTGLIHCTGVVNGSVPIHLVTDDITVALKEPELVLITTPANSHRELAELIGKNIALPSVIVLNPGRTLGAIEFQQIYNQFNSQYKLIIAETQTIIYTCRKIDEDCVNIIAFKDSVKISSITSQSNFTAQNILDYLPLCIKKHFVVADSMIETSFGNVGMILHCAPLLLNAGWTESSIHDFNYYYDAITPTIGKFIENIDAERVNVSEALGHKVESTKEWLIRTYHVMGSNLYECIQNNDAYKTISAPKTLNHRYIYEDIPCGLVPLESVGLRLGLKMEYTSLIIDLASKMLNCNFREIGRKGDYLDLLF